MRGSAIYQATQVLENMTFIGQSKHKAKQMARAAGAKTWHEIGQQLKIYSYNTANLYRSVWIETLRYGKDEFHVKDIEKLSPQLVAGFLDAKIGDGIKLGSFNAYCSALEKLAVGLNQLSQEKGSATNYSWTAEIKAAKAEAKEVLDSFVKTRAYANPVGLITAVHSQTYQCIAAAQYCIGARISELDHIQLKQFQEDYQFNILKGKGGKNRTVKFRHSKIYDQYRQLVNNNLNPIYDKFTFDRHQYRLALKIAAGESGQQYCGSHGLRWNYAQERFVALQQSGLTREEALVQVAQEMGHNRGDITERYLK